MFHRWRHAIDLVRALSFLAALVMAWAPPSAAASPLIVLVDLDNNAGTGCTVATPSGNFTGAEQRIVTTIDTTGLPPLVTQVTQKVCTNASTNTFGPPVVISSGS